MLKEILQGRFMRHPLHPVLVHFPIGLWPTSFFLDLAYLGGGASTLAEVSYYCILIGLIGAALAIPTGLAEFIAIPWDTIPKRISLLHLILATTATALYLMNFLSRPEPGSEAPVLITTGQVLLSFLSLVILSVAGYLGGLLVYNYGIGFKPQLRGRGKEEEAASTPSHRAA